ncbi:LysR family transcriptional regulator [Curvibacter lanceolatus]|uniref:LysR family transcriptional regulator n=1 Tax=Curvibacter lanceolatus TaxID=86182 RepID=UPI0003751A19|nr:LysR family transcriptional regulator [Curvibacter lanceolatus]
MAVEMRHLRYFLVLADELHFGRAARRLHIAQPPLSFNIKQLEQTLGVQLLERNSHGVKLTPAGEVFRQSAARVLAETEAATQRARDVALGVTARVRIGFVGSMLFRGLPERLHAFQALHPQVQTELIELNSAQQLEAMARGSIDLGFVHTARVPPDLSRSLYMSEPFVACLPEAHPAGGAQGVDLAALASEPLVLFSRGASPDYYERVLTLSGQLGLQPRVRHEVRHWLSVVALVGKGMGWALVPQALAGSGVAGVAYHLLPPSDIRSEVHLVWNERSMPAVLPLLLGALKPAESPQVA